MQNISFQIKKNLLRNRDWPNGVKPTDDNMHRSEDQICRKAKQHKFHFDKKKTK